MERTQQVRDSDRSGTDGVVCAGLQVGQSPGAHRRAQDNSR